jgi:hypothetical protein
VIYFWILVNTLASLFTTTICIKFFILNHTFKKWLRLYGAAIAGYHIIIYTLTLTGIISLVDYSSYVRPFAWIILIYPALEAGADWTRRK